MSTASPSRPNQDQDQEAAVAASAEGPVPQDAPASCPGTESASAGKSASCAGCPNQQACASGKGVDEDPDVAVLAQKLGPERCRHKILVMSGKGGVGKSTFAAQLAFALAADVDTEVALVDVDICGPSAPRLLGVEGQEVRMSGSGWQPAYASDNLACMSVGLMLSSQDDALIWRGARKTGLIKQLFRDVDWGSTLDYMLVDTPPGTSDEHITVAQLLKGAGMDGALIVTTPQELALLDVRKEITFCRQANIPVLGVVENMAGFVCPACSHCTDVFTSRTPGAVQAMCREIEVEYLGKVPLDSAIAAASDSGRSLFETPNSTPTPGVAAIQAILANLQRALIAAE